MVVLIFMVIVGCYDFGDDFVIGYICFDLLVDLFVLIFVCLILYW